VANDKKRHALWKNVRVDGKIHNLERLKKRGKKEEKWQM